MKYGRYQYLYLIILFLSYIYQTFPLEFLKLSFTKLSTIFIKQQGEILQILNTKL